MGEAEFTIAHADEYPAILETRGKVMADYDARKAMIKRDAEKAALALGGVADLTDSLLEEVTSLVEWPVVLTAKFEEKFLAVPSEALVYTMKVTRNTSRFTTKRQPDAELYLCRQYRVF